MKRCFFLLFCLFISAKSLSNADSRVPFVQTEEPGKCGTQPCESTPRDDGSQDLLITKYLLAPFDYHSKFVNNLVFLLNKYFNVPMNYGLYPVAAGLFSTYFSVLYSFLKEIYAEEGGNDNSSRERQKRDLRRKGDKDKFSRGFMEILESKQPHFVDYQGTSSDPLVKLVCRGLPQPKKDDGASSAEAVTPTPPATVEGISAANDGVSAHSIGAADVTVEKISAEIIANIWRQIAQEVQSTWPWDLEDLEDLYNTLYPNGSADIFEFFKQVENILNKEFSNHKIEEMILRIVKILNLQRPLNMEDSATAKEILQRLIELGQPQV